MAPVQLAGWLIGAGYVAVFLALTALASRRAGRSLWLFDHPGQARAAWGFRLGFAALALWPLAGFGWSAASLAWPALAAFGAALALWAQWHMGRSWRIGTAAGKTGPLVTGGPFALSRNPVFVGQIVLAWALVPLAGWVMLLGALLVTAAAVAQVRAEEAVLSHQADWRAYAGRVARWIGRV